MLYSQWVSVCRRFITSGIPIQKWREKGFEKIKLDEHCLRKIAKAIFGGWRIRNEYPWQVVSCLSPSSCVVDDANQGVGESQAKKEEKIARHGLIQFPCLKNRLMNYPEMILPTSRREKRQMKWRDELWLNKTWRGTREEMSWNQGDKWTSRLSEAQKNLGPLLFLLLNNREESLETWIRVEWVLEGSVFRGLKWCEEWGETRQRETDTLLSSLFRLYIPSKETGGR